MRPDYGWHRAEGVLGELPPTVTAMRNSLAAKIEPLEQWLLGLPPNEMPLWNSLCEILPYIAEHDPAFAKTALDPATWKQIVRGDSEFTREKKDARLKFVEIGFAHVLIMRYCMWWARWPITTS